MTTAQSDRVEPLRFGPQTTFTTTDLDPDAVDVVARASKGLRRIADALIVVDRHASLDEYAIWDDVALDLARESFDAAAEAWPQE